MATFDAPQHILINFEELSQNAMYFFLRQKVADTI